jgi:hypothetical protein
VYTNSNGHCLLDNSTRHQTRNMSMSAVGQVIGASIFMASQRTEPYEPSISSSASSSQTPIVSDAASTQRSVASSISYNSRSNQGDARYRYCALAQLQQKHISDTQLSQTCHQQLTYADVTSVPSQQRQHPRHFSLAKHQTSPSLVRQADRKVNLVDNLVGKFESYTLLRRLLLKLTFLETLQFRWLRSSGHSL